MRIGAEKLLATYGSPLGVAEALLKGQLESYDQQFVGDVVDHIIMEAARMRVASGRIEALEACVQRLQYTIRALGAKVGLPEQMINEFLELP